jgi:hypothetical protein
VLRKKKQCYCCRDAWIKANPVRWIIALWLAVFSFTSRLNSTAIAVIVRPSRIVIAADAKSVLTNSSGSSSAQICKIYQAGASFFAFSGMDQDDNIGFVSSEIAKRIAAPSIKARAEKFAEDVRKPLLESLQRSYRVAPSRDEYRKLFGGEFPLAAIFFGMEQGISIYEAVQTTKIEDASGKPIRIDTEIRVCPGLLCPEPEHSRLMWLGETTAAQNEFGRMRAAGDSRLGDDVAVVRHLVETEIAARPDIVGPPVAVLVLDATGSLWVVNGECGKLKGEQERQPNPKKPR